MFWKFKRQVDTIFVDSNSADFHIESSVNVILSPSLYWVKKVSLPLQSLREVKPLLESLFEDMLPEGRYSYEAYKFGDEYFIFAYEDKYILDLLAQKGVPASKINGVYFAQNEFLHLEEAKKIDESEVILVKDDIVILLPAKFTAAQNMLDVTEIKLSKHRITLKQFGHILNEKSLYTIVALFVVLLLLVATEYIITLNKIDKLQTQRDNIFHKYALKPTMMQNRSLLKGYEESYKRQMQLRKVLGVVLGMHLKPKHKVKFIAYKNRKVTLHYSGLKKGDEGYIETYFRAKSLNYSAKYKNNIWYVEVKL